MKIGVYVGSFNPVHKGHIELSRYLIKNKIVDKVLMLPTPNYWHKQNLIDVKHRVGMLKIFETKNIIIDDIHNIYPYTYQILKSLKEDYKYDELYLVIGGDNLEKLHLWKNIDEIMKNKIVVVRRANKDIDINKYQNRFDINKFIIVNDFDDYEEISSTEIRKNINSPYLDKKVFEYIKKNKLYLNENS